MPELLLELLSEEIPARMQARAADDLKRLVCDGLKKAGLEFSSAEAYVTPRRLALVVDGLAVSTPDISEEKRGPSTSAPEQAVAGFKGSLPKGTKVEKRETEKGEFFFALVEQKGKETKDLLGLMIFKSFSKLVYPKSMKWSKNKFSWVRPLKNILLIFNGLEIEGVVRLGRGEPAPSLGGYSSHMAMIQKDTTAPDWENYLPYTNETTGHRLFSPKPFSVKNFADYKAKLEKHHVILDARDRAILIEKEAGKLASKAKLKLKDDPGLLAEVAGLVEWPVVHLGSIDADFMDLPPEVLTTTMRNHQKYFALIDGKGKLAAKFIVVANTETSDKGKVVVAGNERVLRARLSDAKFFWDQDRQQRLDSRIQNLGGRVFHARLGTVLDKVIRVEQLASALAPFCKANPGDAMWAARLAKADLSTGMVGEFPELQGIMGRYYALGDGEKPDVADAIAEHYAPQGPGDACPKSPLSITVALADKIDTLVGFWAIDEKPTGSKDPFALRRAAISIIRLIVENGLRLPLGEAFAKAAENFDDTLGGVSKTFDTQDLLNFIAERLKVHLKEKGVKHDYIDAVFSQGGEDDLVRLLARVDALGAFLETDNGDKLLKAYRRAANIVRIEEKKDGRKYDGEYRVDLLTQDEEKKLATYLDEAVSGAKEALHGEDFTAAMLAIAKLQDSVDAFFDKVTVNVEGDEPLRENRLRLLGGIAQALDQVADFSKIEGGER